jgi:hypothetical protein
MTHRTGIHVAGAEFVSRNRRCAMEVLIVNRQVYVRESVATVQWSKSAAVVPVKAGNAETSAVSSIPRMEMIARS